MEALKVSKEAMKLKKEYACRMASTTSLKYLMCKVMPD